MNNEPKSYFAAGTVVLTDVGMKFIEDIQVGDRVFGIERKWHTVEQTYKSEKECYPVKFSGIAPLYTTLETQYVSREMHYQYINSKDVRVLRSATIKSVSDMTNNDFAGYPILQEETTSHYSNEILWLIGRYLADGHTRDSAWNDEHPEKRIRQVVMTIGTHKLDEFKQKVPTIHFSTYVHQKTACRCTFGVSLWEIIQTENLGHKANEKRLPWSLMSLNNKQLKVLLDGYWSGDGYIDNNRHSANSTSKQLMYQLALLFSRVYNVPTSLGLHVPPEYRKIKGVVYHQNPYYWMHFSLHASRTAQIFNNNSWWSRFEKIDFNGTKMACYGLCVENNSPFLVDNRFVVSR